MKTDVIKNGAAEPYQKGTVENLMSPEKVFEEIQTRKLPQEDGCVYFCGTLLMRDSKFKPGDAYYMTLEDPVSGCEIDLSYTVTVLKDDMTYFKL